MEHIWAPWRIRYIQAEKPVGCFLCEKSAREDDAASYILFRGEKNFVILNGYPYNPGHLLVAPYRHVAGLEKLTAEERHEHIDIVSRSTEVLGRMYHPDGLNIGINLGRAAGAGLEDHVHTHIVPRWQGDTNFMTVAANIRVLPDALAAVYQKLAGEF
jgi:ATP adenylyltransferase